MPRKKPFSNKQKKVQILHKREKKRDKLESEIVEASQLVEGEVCEGPIVVDKVHEQPLKVGTSYDPNRYRLHFERESRAEIERRKLLAKREIIKPVGEESLEVGVEGVYRPGSVLDIPRRPPWNYSMGKAEVEGQEEAMFEEYLREIYSNHKTEDLSYFEHNLETWRQLWRVLEISDVILFITDARHPALHFSPALYNYVVKDLKKQLVLILNKIDLVPPQVAVAWRHYFLSKFPEVNVICFTSYPSKDISTQPSKKVHLKFRRSGRNLPSAVGPQELLSVLEDMYRGKVDTAGWKAQASPTTIPDNVPRTITPDDGPRTIPPDNGTSSSSESESGDHEIAMATMSSNPLERDCVSAGVLTLGLVGHPNVGKSSIINGLLRRKAVSTSRTPGHTKHFQTVFLSPSLRLCDCPGLVFPSLVNRQLQVLSGIYPVAQVREPYTAVGYITARLPIVEMLALQHPNTVATVAKKTKGRRTGDFELDDSIQASHVPINDCHVMSAEPQQWTAWEVCDAWADKRGYITARGARLDTYRAANSLLRLVVDGRICLYFVPPGYTKDKDYWVGHSEVGEMLALQSEGMSSTRTDVISSEEEEAQEETIKSTLNKFALLANVDD